MNTAGKSSAKLGVLLAFLATVALAAGILFYWLWQQWHLPLVSPLSIQTSFRFLTQKDDDLPKHQRLVYGYLPYWNLNKFVIQPELNRLAYFGMTIGSDGTILTKTTEGVEPGYQKWSSESVLDILNTQEKQGGNVELVLTQFNTDDIAAFVSSPAAHQQLIKSLDSLMLSYQVDGINIDIEYSGTVTPGLRRGMADFMRTLSEHVKQKNPKTKISMAVYASAASRQQIWDIPALTPSVDYFVIMAYDFHRRSSPVAGPVAPIFGGKELWDSDISQHMRDFLLVAPKEKLLLGIPFYGYEWQTTSRDPQAHTFPETGATASFSRVQEILAQSKELKVETGWNEQALSPYITYQKGKDIFVIYYENSRSISYKLDLVNQLDLAGVAIWALGYEGDSRELWDVIHRKFEK